MTGNRWPRDAFAEAVWTSRLPSSQRLVALAFADHAHDGDESWLTYDRLQERTGLSRDSVARHLRGLVDGGWLVLLRRRRCGSGVYRLTVPEQSDSRTTSDAQQSDGRTTEPLQQSDGRTTSEVQQSDPAAQQSDPAALAVRQSDSTSVPTSVPTSLSAREEDRPAMHTTERETTGDGDSFGARNLAALGRADLTARQLDTLHARTADRLGLDLAADAVRALVALPNVRNLPAYLARLSDDDLRDLAEQHRERRERTGRPAAKREARPKCDDPSCGPLRRVEHPDDGRDLGPCPRCHPSTALASA